ncbi:hypothetical protein I7I50_00545 [Histoplasma capsulatum G186AR]|uniref:Uncharacterized protein n=1 Tax=Ajellomyces capsulatus TaxID=5037 RepID=A0A8H8CUU6_AJECA|nr:hypothetical protein I7I52_07813 [Histoplasma capsulatum]QSS72633.1 hypothetical protein I7I50_00545 [Histoplasma capsulatum G186AR]
MQRLCSFAMHLSSLSIGPLMSREMLPINRTHDATSGLPSIPTPRNLYKLSVSILMFTSVGCATFSS